MLVSPTIRNLKVMKMLVDGGAEMNLISPSVISKLQIAEEELEVTCMFLKEICPRGNNKVIIYFLIS